MKEVGRYNFYLAGENDDKELKALLKNNPISSGICVSFQRKPDFFTAAKSGYKLCQVITARDKENNKLCGVGSRALFEAYINGARSTMGYLSNLRIAEEYRNSHMLFRGYEYFRSLHSDMKAKIYVTTIVEGNERARRLITSGRAGLPFYNDCGVYMSNAVLLCKKRRSRAGRYRVTRGSLDKIEDILDCMHKNGSIKQFYPYYSAKDLLPHEGRFKDFNIEDIYMASYKGKIVGIAAKWDQRSFKQLVVTDYKGMARVVKPFYNFFASRILGTPTLPKCGSPLNFFCISFIAIENNDYRIFEEILEAIYNDNISSGYDYFLVGLHSADALLAALKGFPRVCYKSRIYAVCWEDGMECFRSLDGRVPYLEIGIL